MFATRSDRPHHYPHNQHNLTDQATDQGPTRLDTNSDAVAYGDWEDDGGVVLGGDAAERLKVPQLRTAVQFSAVVKSFTKGTALPSLYLYQ